MLHCISTFRFFFFYSSLLLFTLQLQMINGAIDLISTANLIFIKMDWHLHGSHRISLHLTGYFLV